MISKNKINKVFESYGLPPVQRKDLPFALRRTTDAEILNVSKGDIVKFLGKEYVVLSVDYKKGMAMISNRHDTNLDRHVARITDLEYWEEPMKDPLAISKVPSYSPVFTRRKGDQVTSSMNEDDTGLIRVNSLVKWNGKRYRVMSIDNPSAVIADWRDNNHDNRIVPLAELEFIT